jgi:hypothetical protein
MNGTAVETEFPEPVASQPEFVNWSPARSLPAILGAALGSLLLAACAGPQPASTPLAGDIGPIHYIVTADSTSFYKYGPAQASGPDLRLKKGDLLTMVQRRFGYSRVIDADGDAGYVPTDDIAPAPAAQTASLSPSLKKTRGAAAPANYDGQPDDSVLPSKQPPSDQPAPSFRY